MKNKTWKVVSEDNIAAKLTVGHLAKTLQVASYQEVCSMALKYQSSKIAHI